MTLITGLLIPLLGTMLGSAFVFFMKDEMSVRVQKTLLQKDNKIASSVILVILSKIRVVPVWRNHRTFADELTIVGENRRRLGNLSELNCTRLALSLQRI